jgi:multiple sugar transport system substrate-binding protein
MTVISGLAIPKNAVDTDSIGLLVDFLTMPSVQSRMLLETGFFPVLELAKGDDSAGKMNELSKAVSGQSNAKNSIPTLLPVGLGDSGGTYNNIFMLTFSQIVLEGKNIDTVLNTSAGELQTIIDKQNLKCWLPDVSSERPCQIE